MDNDKNFIECSVISAYYASTLFFLGLASILTCAYCCIMIKNLLRFLLSVNIFLKFGLSG